MIPAFRRQLRNEDCFIKRQLPPMARRNYRQFHVETKVVSDQQPPKATEAAVRRRLRTSTQTRSAPTKVTDWFEACGPGGGHLLSASGIGPGNSVAPYIRLADVLIIRQARPDLGN